LAASSAKFRAQRFRHNDCAHLERLLKATRERAGSASRVIFVAVEGVYSMDGDLAPLAEMRALCDRYGANLVVDDAHGTAVMGETGGGTAEHCGIKGRVEIAMGTFSKAFGTTGGFLAGSREVIDYLRFFSRSYMFSAHLPPPTVAAVLAGLDMIEREPDRLVRLHENAEYLASGLRALGYAAERQAAILPLLIPSSVDIRALAHAFHREGVFLNSVEYPAVPLDAQRLRISVMATHTREDLDGALGVFERLGRRFGLIGDGGVAGLALAPACASGAMVAEIV
jgi:7-keto-8-aminopelargonate synthetase-like enzyme